MELLSGRVPKFKVTRRPNGAPFGAKAMGLRLVAAHKLHLLQRIPGKNMSPKPRTINKIETLRFCAFAPPGAPLDQQSLISTAAFGGSVVDGLRVGPDIDEGFDHARAIECQRPLQRLTEFI